jgi:hypothetical protein
MSSRPWSNYGTAVVSEHMPPKALFDRSHRPDKLAVPACGVCNKASSKADLTVAIISRWRSDSDKQELADHAKLARQAKTYAPELVAERNAFGYSMKNIIVCCNGTGIEISENISNVLKLYVLVVCLS